MCGVHPGYQQSIPQDAVPPSIEELRALEASFFHCYTNMQVALANSTEIHFLYVAPYMYYNSNAEIRTLKMPVKRSHTHTFPPAFQTEPYLGSCILHGCVS